MCYDRTCSSGWRAKSHNYTLPPVGPWGMVLDGIMNAEMAIERIEPEPLGK
jgi:hypothetical protein